MAVPARPVAVAATKLLLACTLVGCAEPTGELQVPDADPIVFRDKVYPILLRDCGFVGCHGTEQRFFAVFGPGRTRLDPKTNIFDPPTDTELSLTFSRARSMLEDPEGPGSSLLVRKPIPRAQGGAGHGGDDEYGVSVYRSTGDARFMAIYQWATAGSK